MTDHLFTPENLVSRLKSMKERGEKIAALTAYDYPMAKLLDEAGVDILLVGDSLGMVVLGYPDTTSVTIEDMVHHTSAAARAKPHALLTADMPYRSYDTPSEALTNAQKLIAAGAQAIKMEGGIEILPQIETIRSAGIQVIGHLGMLPQHILEEGGKYHIKGKMEEEQQQLIQSAVALEKAGVAAIVLELIKHDFTTQITRSIQIPTIVIASGPDCDGQILVIHDLIGAFPWFIPKFITPVLKTGADTRQAAADWIQKLKKNK